MSAIVNYQTLIDSSGETNTLTSALPTHHHYEIFSWLCLSFPADVLGCRVDRVKDSSTLIPQNNPSLPGSPLNNQMHNKVGFPQEEFLLE